MLEIRGKYNTAQVFTDTIGAAAIAQLVELCSQSFCRDSLIRVMPDVHAGAGCTVGTTMTIRDKIVPNLVGVDIGCGVEVMKLREKTVDFARLDDAIRTLVPSGFAVHQSPIKAGRDMERELEGLRCVKQVDMIRVYCPRLYGQHKKHPLAGNIEF